MQREVVEVRNLVKVYDGVRAVDGISFTVARGEVFAFLGPNGAGKTTTIEILECLRPKTGGEARVFGLDVSDPAGAREIRSRIGVLPQDFKGLDKLTVLENVRFFAKLYGRSVDVEEILRRLGLWERRKQRFDKLSGGLKQRVGLAAALVNDPELVFLDEPTTGLDPSARRGVWDVIREFSREGKTVFLTTHYMEEAEYLADHIAIINKGRIVAYGSPSELIRAHGGARRLVLKRMAGLREELENLGIEVEERGSDLELPFTSIRELHSLLDALKHLGDDVELQIRSPGIEDVFLNLLGSRITEEGVLA